MRQAILGENITIGVDKTKRVDGNRSNLGVILKSFFERKPDFSSSNGHQIQNHGEERKSTQPQIYTFDTLSSYHY